MTCNCNCHYGSQEWKCQNCNCKSKNICPTCNQLTSFKIHKHEMKYYTITTLDLGKTIQFCECGVAIIN